MRGRRSTTAREAPPCQLSGANCRYSKRVVGVVKSESGESLNHTIAEVVVVGGGPVGLTAAIALAGAGVEDRADRACPRPPPTTAHTALLASSVTALDTARRVWALLRGAGRAAPADATGRRHGAAVAGARGAASMPPKSGCRPSATTSRTSVAGRAGAPRPRHSRAHSSPPKPRT